MSTSRFRTFIISLIAALAALTSSAQDNNPQFTIKPPKVYGTIRARAEWSTAIGDTRFQVRTGRVGVIGAISPVFDYKAELDLCDRGKVVVTDVWAGADLTRGFRLQAGQMRMPFTFGSARGPQSYLFANRPFTDKQFIGPRNVGVKLAYRCPSTPLTIEAGAFNATSKGDHAVWQKRLAYAAKALYKIQNVTLITGFEQLCPGEHRINHFDAGITWTAGRFMAEAEYIHKHFCGAGLSDSDNAHALNIMADYGIPLRLKSFNRLSFQARYDEMTDNWDGTRMTSGEFVLPAFSDQGRSRVTIGSTLTYRYGPVWADIRINYEQVWMRHDLKQTADTGNKLLAELVIRF